VAKFREKSSIHREGPLITAVETATNVAKTISFNGEGEFARPFLTAGHYPVSVVKDGFKRYEQDNILLQVSDSISLKMAVPIGAVTVGTTVNTVVQEIRTADADLGTVIDTRQLEDLPGMPPLTQSDFAHDTEPTSPRPYLITY
jgi:hypothetical protein